MPSSEEKARWVTRWRYEIALKATRPGVWRLKGGGYFVRCRVTDPRTGKEHPFTKVLRGEGIALRDALRAQDQLRLEGRAQFAGQPSPPLWSEYAASLFEAKVTEGKLKSPKSRERWANTLARLVPAFGRFRVDELRYADLITWRDQVALWIRNALALDALPCPATPPSSRPSIRRKRLFDRSPRGTESPAHSRTETRRPPCAVRRESRPAASATRLTCPRSPPARGRARRASPPDGWRRGRVRGDATRREPSPGCPRRSAASWIPCSRSKRNRRSSRPKRPSPR